MILSGIWKTPYFRDAANFPWDTVPIPRVSWSPRAVVGGSSGYGIASTSEHKKEAWDLIAFLSGAQGQAELATTGLVQPALEAVAESSAFLDGKDPHNKRFLLRIVDTALDDPLATNWLDVKRKVVLPALDKVWDGQETPEKALKDLNLELWNHPLDLK
jgi:multiple sugar transport system substrate-binding protein